MAYPYNPKIAPAIGNGLGGLPQKAVAVASSVTASKKSYPLKLTPVGNTISNSSFRYAMFLTPLSDGVALCQVRDTNSVYLTAITYNSDSGAISFSTPLNLGALHIGNPIATFNQGQIYSSQTGVFRIATFNGTTVSLSAFCTIPTSGTLTAGGTYTSISNNYDVMVSTYPKCFDENGNLVILLTCQIAGASNLCAFVIDSLGTIILSKVILNINGINPRRFNIRKTKAGYLLIGVNWGSNNNENRIWNLDSAFLATAINSPSVYNYNNTAANRSNIYINDDVIMINTVWDNDNANIAWAVRRDVLGNAISRTQNTFQTFNNNTSYPITTNLQPDISEDLWYTSASLVTLTDYSSSYNAAFGAYKLNALSTSGEDLSFAFRPTLVATIQSEFNPNGNGFDSMVYLGNGLWMGGWTVSTLNICKVKLYKELT